MAKQIMRKTTLERSELYTFCDELPAPVVAVPVVTGKRGTGLQLHLRYRGEQVTIVENGRACTFRSLDDVVFALDGAPNVRTQRLIVDAEGWFS